MPTEKPNEPIAIAHQPIYLPGWNQILNKIEQNSERARYATAIVMRCVF